MTWLELTTSAADSLPEEIRFAVVIPAATCPCQQVEAVRPQLKDIGCLVVVWNGPRTTSFHDCAHQTLSEGATVWLESPDQIGAAAARNRGVAWLRGRAGALAFVDADDVADANWLGRLLTPLLTGSADLVGGSLQLHVRGRSYAVLPGTDFWYRQALYGSNCALTLESWEKLGGFRSGVGTCEDTDLGWRAVGLGLRVRLEPSAVVRYALRQGWAEWRQRFVWGRSSVALLRAHNLPLSRHLPRVWGLVRHKSTYGFASNPWMAGLGQYAGQCVGRVLDRRPAPAVVA